MRHGQMEVEHAGAASEVLARGHRLGHGARLVENLRGWTAQKVIDGQRALSEAVNVDDGVPSHVSRQTSSSAR